MGAHLDESQARRLVDYACSQIGPLTETFQACISAVQDSVRPMELRSIKSKRGKVPSGCRVVDRLMMSLDSDCQTYRGG